MSVWKFLRLQIKHNPFLYHPVKDGSHLKFYFRSSKRTRTRTRGGTGPRKVLPSGSLFHAWRSYGNALIMHVITICARICQLQSGRSINARNVCMK